MRRDTAYPCSKLLALLTLLLLIRSWHVAGDAFSCNFSIVGNSSYPSNLTFAEVSIGCTPVPPTDTSAKLNLFVDQSLMPYSAAFSGVEVQPMATGQEDLLLIYDPANITFEHSSFVNIEAWYLEHLLEVIATTNQSLATFEGFQCNGCNSSQALTRYVGGNFTMLDSQFVDLQTTAAYIAGSFAFVSNSSFQGQGGAVQMQSGIVVSVSSGVEVANCSFSNLVTTANGGAIYAEAASAAVIGSVFFNNSGFTGGAINILASTGNLANNTFNSNKATTGDGGAVLLEALASNVNPLAPNFTVSSSTYVNNVAANSAAGIRAMEVYLLDIRNCSFHFNTANGILQGPWQGSAIGVDNDHAATNVFLHDSIITDSLAGASVFLRNALCVGVINTVFANSSQVGLVILGTIGDSCEDNFADSEDILFHSDTTTAVSSDQESIKDFFVGAQTTNDIRFCTFFNHTLDQQPSIEHYAGGAPRGTAAALLIAGGLISHNILAGNLFTSNSGIQGSGIQLMSCSATVIWNSSFSSNTASQQGGALSSVLNAVNGVLLGESVFVNNSALRGGALHGDTNTQYILLGGNYLMGNTAKTFGGGLFCEACWNVEIGSEEDGGGIHCDACQLLFLNGTQVLENRAIGSGGGLNVIGTGATLFNMTNCTAKSNQAGLDGGVVSLTGGAAVLSNNLFLQNTAGVNGGALAYTYQCFAAAVEGNPSLTFPWSSIFPQLSELTSNCSVIISTGDTYEQNFATSAGGALFSTAMNTTLVTCPNPSSQLVPALQEVGLTCANPTWSNDTVSEHPSQPGYGPTQAFLPAQISVAPPNFVNHVSNGSSMLPMVVKVLDQADQFVTTGAIQVNVSVMNVTPQQSGNEAFLSGQTLTSLDASGVANIQDLILRAAPGFYNLAVALAEYPQVPQVKISLTVRACILGEVQQNPTQCTTCPLPQYSYNALNHTCDSPCPRNANCTGGAVVVPLEGFWVSARTSDSMVACPVGQACQGDRAALQACLSAESTTLDNAEQQQVTPALCGLSGDVTNAEDGFMQMQCSDGYHGPACTLCVRNSTHSFGRTGGLKCHACQRPALIIGGYIGSTLLVMLYLCYNIHTTLQENTVDVQGPVETVKVSELLRALTLWLQYTSLLGQINLPTPTTLHWVFSTCSFAFSSLTSGSLSTDCLLSLGPTNLAFKRLLLQLAVPPIVLVLLLTVQLCWWWLDRLQSSRRLAARDSTEASISPQISVSVDRAELNRRLLVTLLTVLFFYFPSIFTTTLAFFTCYHLDSPATFAAYPGNAKAAWRHGYWLSDMTVPCWTRWHVKHALPVALPMLLVCVLIPSLPALLLFKQRKYLKSAYMRIRLGFIYQPYRPSLWFWDSLVLWQTFALALALALTTPLNSYYQLTVVLMILILGFALLTHLRPFRAALSQSAQVLGLFTVVATAVGCLYMINTSMSFVASKSGLDAAGGILLVLNAAFVLIMVDSCMGVTVVIKLKA